MKQSHLTTPRTLADCQFTSGYRSAEPTARPRLTVADVLLACAIGGGFAALLIAWWTT